MDGWEASTSQHSADINWELCVLCQEQTAESLISPLQSKIRDVGKGYQSLAENLIKFNELNKLSKTLQSRLDKMNDDGKGIEAALVTNKAKWHKTCVLRYNNQKLQRAIKKEHEVPVKDEAPRKSVRLQSTLHPIKVSCLFCDKEAGSEGLHEVMTGQVEEHVRECAELTSDSLLLAKL